MCRGVKFEDRIGQVFNGIEILEVLSPKANPDRTDRTFCKARCHCGATYEAYITSITGGTSKSCGCSRRSDWFSRLKSTYKKSAKRKGYSYDLSDEFFLSLVTSDCHYCKVEPENVTVMHGMEYRWNGIDRISNETGYEPDNVVACCTKCNYAKRDMSYDEFISYLRRIAEVYAKHV